MKPFQTEMNGTDSMEANPSLFSSGVSSKKETSFLTKILLQSNWPHFGNSKDNLISLPSTSFHQKKDHFIQCLAHKYLLISLRVDPIIELGKKSPNVGQIYERAYYVQELHIVLQYCPRRRLLHRRVKSSKEHSNKFQQKGFEVYPVGDRGPIKRFQAIEFILCKEHPS